MAIRRTTRHSQTSQIQRISAVAYSLFILFQTPLFELDFVDKDGGQTRYIPFSPLEATSVSLLALDKMYKPLAQVLLLPGAWLKLFTRFLSVCISGNLDSCQPSVLVNAPFILASADYSDKLDVWATVDPRGQGLLSASCAVLVICAVSMPVAPKNYIVLLAFLLLFASLFLTNCAPLPSAAFCCLLAATAVFGKSKEPAPGSSSKTQAGAAAKPTAGSPAKSPAKKGK